MKPRAFVIAALIVALLASPLLSPAAPAADVPVTLIAFNVSWHLGTEAGAAQPNITATAGDVLRLRVENHDGFLHTFTVPHFSVSQNLAAGSSATPTVVFVNITTSTADNGKWVFYCSIPGHTTGSGETRDGMVGWIQVGAVRPPPTPGFEVVLVIAALAAVAIAIRFVPRRKK